MVKLELFIDKGISILNTTNKQQDWIGLLIFGVIALISIFILSLICSEEHQDFFNLSRAYVGVFVITSLFTKIYTMF